MAINLVQSAAAITAFTVGPSRASHSATCAFASNNAATNAIMVAVFVGGGNNAGYGITTPMSVSDTQGNAYTQVIQHTVGNLAGAAIAFYYATGILAGANTVTFAFDAPVTNTGLTTTVDPVVLIAEYSGLGSFSVQDSQFQSIFGSAGNAASVLTFTDSHSASVSLTIQGPGGTAGIGTNNTGALVVDLLSGGVNYLIAACLANRNDLSLPTTSPSGYQTFGQEQLASDATNGYYGYFWDAGAPVATITRPQIFVVT
jgi:hypothetical protein